jgi:hypothetical protein
MATTDNYKLVKYEFGYPVRDDHLGSNLDLIDAAIKAREDETDALSALASGKIIVGNVAGVATDVAMSSDVTISNTGATTIGADKVSNTKLANITRGSIKVGGASDAPTDLAAKADAQMLIGDGTDITSVAITGDITTINTGETAIGANKVTIAKVEAALRKDISILSMSFETNEQTTTKIYFPMKVTINKIRSIVMKALAGTNVGTITGANSVGASNNGVVTIAASAALNEEDSASPDSNNVVAADSYYQLTTAKAAAGGKVLVTLEYTRTA